MFSKKKKKTPSEIKWGNDVVNAVESIKICDDLLETLSSKHLTHVSIMELTNVIPNQELHNVVVRLLNKKKQEFLYELKQLKGGK